MAELPFKGSELKNVSLNIELEGLCPSWGFKTSLSNVWDSLDHSKTPNLPESSPESPVKPTDPTAMGFGASRAWHGL